VGVWIGRVTDIGDVSGAKVFYLALMSLAPALIYLVGRDMFGSRLAGATAGGLLLSIPVVAVGATGGPEPKLPMMLGMVIALLLLTRRRWFWAGVATALATLTWQPVLVALVAAAAALLLFERDDLRVRVRNGVAYAAGGLATLVATVAGFAVVGALDVFVEGFWAVNASHTSQSGIFDRPLGTLEALDRGLGWTLPLVLVGLGLALLLGLTAFPLRRSAPLRAANAAALASATGAMLLWSGFAFNRSPDALPLFPLAALGLAEAVGLLAHRVRESRSATPHKVLVGVVAASVVLTAGVTLQRTISERSDAIDRQQALADAAVANFPDDATVFSFEATQPLALTESTSISRIVLFGHGMKDYVATQWDGGLDAYVEWLASEEPDIIFVATRNQSRFLKPLLDDYQQVGGTAGRGRQAWLTYVRDDVDPATVDAIAEDLRSAAGGRAGRD
jgi:4-amino-4-deoxy-L-arabinose transferase-like glycosyltransferase